MRSSTKVGCAVCAMCTVIGLFLCVFMALFELTFSEQLDDKKAYATAMEEIADAFAMDREESEFAYTLMEVTSNSHASKKYTQVGNKARMAGGYIVRYSYGSREYVDSFFRSNWKVFESEISDITDIASYAVWLNCWIPITSEEWFYDVTYHEDGELDAYGMYNATSQTLYVAFFE